MTFLGISFRAREPAVNTHIPVGQRHPQSGAAMGAARFGSRWAGVGRALSPRVTVRARFPISLLFRAVTRRLRTEVQVVELSSNCVTGRSPHGRNRRRRGNGTRNAARESRRSPASGVGRRVARPTAPPAERRAVASRGVPRPIRAATCVLTVTAYAPIRRVSRGGNGQTSHLFDL